MQQASLAAIDLTPEMIRRATELATGVGNARFVIADAEQLPFDDSEFTAVLRRMEPGHVRLYRSRELGSFLQRSGFSHVMLRKLSGGGFAIVRGVAA